MSYIYINMSNKIARWYNTFIFKYNMNYIIDDIFIKKLIENIEYICNNSEDRITLLCFYNCLDKYNRNILHYLHIYNLKNTYLYKYIIDNNYAYDFYKDIFGNKPSDYDYIYNINNINNINNIKNDIIIKSLTTSII